ncbi:LamG domain-containing protein [Spirilliplanes yamanashiensis]|uniref:Concanavalin A-like lectin/glucanase superfamily protein n=1 Tax=Spirilliplanes yamanashiensis TaxID=42233 RepID=A0A8J3Y6D5_9ACTN|nr:LamG domain-containing protein [Spirilliplanes yamanashiensis]MDP9815029.1 hypothetical protein [Spirilliplanes yamanashiensis]GIJ02686.1 hypothetical protein Sya03_20380 [Spirilliplanes yamanashiensis]
MRALAVLTAAVAFAAGLALAGQAAFRQSSAAPAPAAPSPIASPSADPSSPEAPAPGQAAAGSYSVRYFFDGGARQPVLDSTSAHPLRVLTAQGGAIRHVPRAGGWALQFPPRCRVAASTCPRVILQGSRDDSLNPYTRPLRYGAAVLMTRNDTASGANVLQKGYSVGGASQYKLQVDHLAGKPSCVVASRTTIYRAESRYTVADGRWHALACTRIGNRLTLYVDGAQRASRYVPTTLSIANTEPLRIGGKGTAPNNDQYAGQIDNVYVTIG